MAAAVVRGVELSMEAVGARDGVVAIKAKNRHAFEAIEAACHGSKVRLQELGDGIHRHQLYPQILLKDVNYLGGFAFAE